MPNQTKVECYFKSSELEKLCKQGKDIIINFKADYLPGKSPEFTITASVFKKNGKETAIQGMLTDADNSGGGTTSGCPTPCGSGG